MIQIVTKLDPRTPNPRGAEVAVSWAKVVEFAEEKSPFFFGGGGVCISIYILPQKMLNTLLKFNSSPLKVTFPTGK